MSLNPETSLQRFFSDKGKHGLVNIGATCYINTAIQCLSHCLDFLHFILSKKYAVNNQNTMIEHLRHVLVELWLNNHNYSPNKLIESINTHLIIDAYEQNDINEFIILFLDYLNKEIAYKYKPSKKELVTSNRYTKSQYDMQRFKMDISWYEKTGGEYSKLIDLFHGQSITQVVCGHCNHITHNYEVYSNMMLPLTESTNSLEECMDLYFHDETLNDTIEWKCDECKQKSKSIKSLKLWRNPNILIISLKRFTYDMKKNNKLISIPEYLSLDKYTLTNDQYKYRLVSVACHIGSFFGGHYYSICRHPDNNWYMYDDDQVIPIKDDALSHHITKSYVYFYERLFKS
jgi:ubiquitin C-terminal hydrolase